MMRALVVSPDAGTRAEFAAAARGAPALAVDSLGSWPDPAALANRKPPLDLCFLDVSFDPPAGLSMLALLTSELPQLPIVALVGSQDPAFVLQALRAGAAEFLMRPFSAEELTATLRKLKRFGLDTAADPPPSAGRILLVLPGAPGSGATTVATSLAYAMKRRRSGRLLLADMDGLAGTVGFLLKVNSTYSFLDAVKHSSALDRDMWKALVTPCHGVDVLLAPEAPVDCAAEGLDAAPVLESARQAYDTVVIDAGSVLGGWNSALARQADELLLVTSAELPALRATRLSIESLSPHEVTSKPRVVLNRARTRAAPPDLEVFHTLPSDPDALERALMEGRPPAPGSAFGKAIAGLAQALVFRPGPDRRRTRSLFARLFA